MSHGRTFKEALDALIVEYGDIPRKEIVKALDDVFEEIIDEVAEEEGQHE